MKDKKVERTVTELLEDIAAELCDRYCKWPDLYSDSDRMMAEICVHCPLVVKL